MTCREATEFLTEYIAGELPGPILADFEGHLSRCGNCRVFLAQFKDTVQAGSRAFEDPEAAASAAMPEDLVTAILATVKKT